MIEVLKYTQNARGHEPDINPKEHMPMRLTFVISYYKEIYKYLQSKYRITHTWYKKSNIIPQDISTFVQSNLHRDQKGNKINITFKSCNEF